MSDPLHAYCERRDDARPISDSSNEHCMLERLRAGLGDCDAATLTPQ